MMVLMHGAAMTMIMVNLMVMMMMMVMMMVMIFSQFCCKFFPVRSTNSNSCKYFKNFQPSKLILIVPMLLLANVICQIFSANTQMHRSIR